MIAATERGHVRRGPDAHRLLLRALLDLLPDAALVASATRPWASNTFAGARHDMVVTLPGAEAAARFVAEVGEWTFGLRGHIVADIVATAGDDGRVTIAALTVEDA